MPAYIQAVVWCDSSYEQMVSINNLNDQSLPSRNCVIMYEDSTAGGAVNIYADDS